MYKRQFPLSVEYEEKLYSVGKIPGGFNKREGKASENSVLTSRVIDRPMRPLFPKDYRNDVTLNNLVLSVDPACRPESVSYTHLDVYKRQAYGVNMSHKIDEVMGSQDMARDAEADEE